MVYPKIWFLRHGQTEWNAERRIQGQLESRLSPVGIAHAKEQSLLMANVLEDGIACYASPLGRAQQTADIALGGAPFVTDHRLAEAYAGVLQGMTLEDVAVTFPEIFENNPSHLELFCAAPEGEGFDAFHARIKDFMDSLTGPSVIVAHGLLGQVLRGIACGLSRKEMSSLSNLQGCVYVLEDGQEFLLN